MFERGTIHEPARETPVFRTCDVLVVGGGPAGCAAAAASARLGADTMLVERYGYLGGMSTGGFVLWIDRMSDWEGRQVIAGFASELLARLPKEGLMGPPPNSWGLRDFQTVEYWAERHAAWHGIVTWSPTTDPELLKIAYIDLLNEGCAKLLLHMWAVAPVQEGNEIQGIVFESKSGRQAILAKTVIDATGDGDIFALAGASFEDDVQSGEIHGTMNVAFRWSGVDVESYARFRRERVEEHETLAMRIVERVLQVSRVPHRDVRGVLPWRFPRNDVVYFMGPRLLGYSCVDVEDLTVVELESRRLMMELLDFYRGNVPGFEKAWIMDTAPQIGVRHSRRLVGAKRVTVEDWTEGRLHEDEIGVCPAPTPRHPNVSIPLGCLVPVKLENLLVAGRNLSCDLPSHAFLREIPVCWVMGQAAGTAAAVAVGAGVRVRDADVGEVRTKLIDQGVYLNETSSGC